MTIGRLILLTATTVFALQTNAESADAIPTPDGHYLASDQECDALKAGNLEFVEFTVEASGRAYSMAEAGCVVASAKKIRENRHLVESDCTEADSPVWQHRIIVDIPASGILRLDGRELRLCDYDSTTKSETPQTIIAALPARDVPLPSFAPKSGKGRSGDLLNSLFGGGADEGASRPSADIKIVPPDSTLQLIERWHVANEGCRGGHGDDPKTDEWCGIRDGIHAELDNAGWCYGRDPDKGTAQYDWHACNKDSIRYHQN